MPEIIAYGSGEMLHQVFTAISMLMNDQSAHFYKPLLRMGALVGGLWALSKAFFESSISGLIFHWMIPMAAFVGICLIPSTSVIIIDVLAGGPLGAARRVDHVPLGLARAAQSISYIGNLVTKAVETAFHAPDHSLYNKTGMIFGAENLLEMSRYAITNEHLADTMREFIHNCVTYDLTLELYSINDLKTAPDIWRLIAQNTSNVRMFSYCEPKAAASAEGATTPQDKRTRCKLVSCKEGTVALGRLLEEYKGKLKADHLLIHLPAFYQQLTGLRKDSQDLLSQQIMMHSLIDAVERKCEASGIGTNFAIRRAYLQQRNTYEVVGGLAAKSLVVLRNILEALIYAAFIFIMPFALMPMGFKVFLKWLWLLVWIQLWPPFYAILNSGIMTVTKHQAAQIPGIRDGLTLLTSTGLHNLALDMQTYAAYASLSIPFLSYALLQGGISSLAQIAGSITGIGQSAGSSAAHDLTTGNYNYGNVQLENLSYGNQTMLQHNLAPSLTTGHTKEDYGTHSVTHTQDSMILNERVSQLPYKLTVAEGASQIVKDTETRSLEMAHREATSVSQTENKIAQQTEALAEHVSHNKAFNHTSSEDSQVKVSQSGQEMMNHATDWGKRHSMSSQTSCQLLVHASRSILGLGGGISASASGTDEKTWQEAQNFVKTSGFVQNYETLKTAIDSSAVSTHDEVGTTMTKNLTNLEEQSTQHQKQYEQHVQRAEMCAKAREKIDQKSFDIHRDETQGFVNSLAAEKDEKGAPFGYQKAQKMIRLDPAACEPYLQRFKTQKINEIISEAMPSHKNFGENLKMPTTQMSHLASASPIESIHLTSNPKHIQSSNYRIQKRDTGHLPSPESSTHAPLSASPEQSTKSLQNMNFSAFHDQASQKINAEEKRILGKQAHITTQVHHDLDKRKEAISKGTETMKIDVQAEQNTPSVTRMLRGIPVVGHSLARFGNITETKRQLREDQQKHESHKKTEPRDQEQEQEQQSRTYDKAPTENTKQAIDYEEPEKQGSQIIHAESNMHPNPKKK